MFSVCVKFRLNKKLQPVYMEVWYPGNCTRPWYPGNQCPEYRYTYWYMSEGCQKIRWTCDTDPSRPLVTFLKFYHSGIKSLLGDHYLWSDHKKRNQILAQFAAASFVVAEIINVKYNGLGKGMKKMLGIAGVMFWLGPYPNYHTLFNLMFALNLCSISEIPY